jgi:hypothetical protein
VRPEGRRRKNRSARVCRPYGAGCFLGMIQGQRAALRSALTPGYLLVAPAALPFCRAQRRCLSTRRRRYHCAPCGVPSHRAQRRSLSSRPAALPFRCGAAGARTGQPKGSAPEARREGSQGQARSAQPLDHDKKASEAREGRQKQHRRCDQRVAVAKIDRHASVAPTGLGGFWE